MLKLGGVVVILSEVCFAVIAVTRLRVLKAGRIPPGCCARTKVEQLAALPAFFVTVIAGFLVTCCAAFVSGARLTHAYSGKLAAIWALIQLKLLFVRILLLLMVRAEKLTLSQRLRMLMLGRACHGAALACPRNLGAAHTMVVAVRADSAERCGVSIARTAPHIALALAVLPHARTAHPCVLIVWVMVAAEALAKPQRRRDGILTAAVHPAALAQPRCALALSFCRPHTLHGLDSSWERRNGRSRQRCVSQTV